MKWFDYQMMGTQLTHRQVEKRESDSKGWMTAKVSKAGHIWEWYVMMETVISSR